MMFKARFKVAESPDVFCAELSSLMAHRVISLRCGIWSLSGAKRTSIKPHQSSRFYEYAPYLLGFAEPSMSLDQAEHREDSLQDAI